MPQTTRTRRIVRRAAMVLGIVVLLPVAYFLSVCSLFVAINADVRLVPVANSAAWRAYMMPVEWYINSEWPGSDLCGGFIDVSATVGSRICR
jgi:hypothetical protein